MAKTTLSFRVTFDDEQVTKSQMNSYIHEILRTDSSHEVEVDGAVVNFDIDDVEVMGWQPMPTAPRDQDITGQDLA